MSTMVLAQLLKAMKNDCLMNRLTKKKKCHTATLFTATLYLYLTNQ